MLRSLDLFTGVGGLTRALRGLATPVMYCERDPNCRQVLDKLMAEGKLPRAPVDGDVTKLRAADIPGKVDIIVAGFPCIGFSHSGVHQGLANPGSSLFFQVERLAKALKPPMLFLENVEGLLSNNDVHTIVARVRALGYDMWWVIVPAYAVGAPQKRARWFCLAVKKGVKNVVIKPSETYVRHNWSSEPVPRLIPKRPEESSKRVARIRMLGNSVVPDCARTGFLSLWTGCTTPVPRLLRLSSKKAGVELRLTPPQSLGPWTKSQDPKYIGVFGTSNAWQRIPKPPGLLPRPDLGLVFDPKAYKHKGPATPARERSSGLVPHARKAALWSTPRTSNGAHPQHVLTERAFRGDLGTQLRFERGTPTSQRSGVTNPEWVEWEMGLPKGWTAF